MKAIMKMGLLVFLIFLSGCATIESRWQEAESADSIQAYNQFIRLYPNSDQADKARDRVTELSWKNALQINTISAYRNFLRKYENSSYAVEAKQQIKIIEEKEAYNKVSKSNSIKALKQFISDYPDSTKNNEITERINVLEQKEEDDLYQLAINSGTYENLQNYIQSYPNGRYYNQIKQKLDSFSWSALSSPETLTWKQLGIEPLNTAELADHIKKSSTLFAFQAFLQGGGSTLVMLRRGLIFCEKDAEVEGWGKVPPSYVFVSEAGKGVVEFEIKEGTALPQINFDTLIAVGSELILRKQDLPVNLYGHFVRNGTIKVVSDGLQLQAGTEILKDDSQ